MPQSRFASSLPVPSRGGSPNDAATTLAAPPATRLVVASSAVDSWNRRSARGLMQR